MLERLRAGLEPLGCRVITPQVLPAEVEASRAADRL
jgi:hypothetical protein